MKTKGSITIFFTLVLSIVFSMMGSLLLSAKTAAGRVQIATAADLALYSAMAKYDRQLFEEYHLLYIDGSYGTGTLQLGNTLEEMESDISYLLEPNKDCVSGKGVNFIQLEKISGAISGYTLATDCQGNVFWEQVVAYMRETLGIQGISLLTQKMKEDSDILQKQEEQKQNMEVGGNIDDYERIKEDSQKIQEEPDPDGEETEESVTEELDPEIRVTGEEAKNMLDTITEVKKSTILQLVMPKEQSVSGWTADKTDVLRNRTVQTGMGYLELTVENPTTVDDLLFQEYLMQNLNCYGSQLHKTGPEYAIEWVLFGNLSDAENLEKSVGELFLIREAANVVALYQDQKRSAEAETLATALALLLKVPGTETALKGAIVLAWAFVETVVDVRSMLDGKRVPLIKNTTNWQVEFTNIVSAVQEPENYYKESSGLNYQDYLRVLLATKSKEEKIIRSMEVIELSMREIEGKEQFSLDCAIDSLEAEFQICVQDYMTFTITEKRSYRSM